MTRIGRRVPAHPREIIKSGAFIESYNNLDTAFHKLLDNLLAAIANGDDINRHQTDKLHTPSNEPHRKVKPINRNDLDLILMQWGMHHLHVSKVKRSGGISKRSSLLLFAIFDEKSFFLIDVIPHGRVRDGTFAPTRLFETAVKNFPHLFIKIGDVSSKLDRSEQLEIGLRDRGINTPIAVDENWWIYAKGGLTLGESGLFHAAHADKILLDLYNNYQVGLTHGRYMTGDHVQFVIHRDHFALRNSRTGYVFEIPYSNEWLQL